MPIAGTVILRDRRELHIIPRQELRFAIVGDEVVPTNLRYEFRHHYVVTYKLRSEPERVLHFDSDHLPDGYLDPTKQQPEFRSERDRHEWLLSRYRLHAAQSMVSVIGSGESDVELEKRYIDHPNKTLHCWVWCTTYDGGSGYR